MKTDPTMHVAGMTRELADRIGGKNVKATDIPAIAQELMRKKRMQLKPEIAGHPAGGQMMLDQHGRKALVMPDGSVKEIT